MGTRTLVGDIRDVGPEGSTRPATREAEADQTVRDSKPARATDRRLASPDPMAGSDRYRLVKPAFPKERFLR